MRKITIEKEVFTFPELSDKAKNNAIISYVAFVGACEDTPEWYADAEREADRLRAPWFFHEIAYEYGKEEIDAELMRFEYFSDGAICPVDDGKGE